MDDLDNESKDESGAEEVAEEDEEEVKKPKEKRPSPRLIRELGALKSETDSAASLSAHLSSFSGSQPAVRWNSAILSMLLVLALIACMAVTLIYRETGSLALVDLDAEQLKHSLWFAENASSLDPATDPRFAAQVETAVLYANKADQAALVLIGSVRNRSETPIGPIDVEGLIYKDGKVAERKVVPAGLNLEPAATLPSL